MITDIEDLILIKNEFKNEVLVCNGKVSKDLAKHLNSDFNAQYNKGLKTNLKDEY